MRKQKNTDLLVKKRFRFPGLATYGLLICIFLYLPLFVVLIYSFNSSTSAFDFSNMTFDWYAKVFQNDKILTALGNSLIVSSISVLFAVMVGTTGAIFLNCVKFRGQNFFKAVANLPIILPASL